jgi:hypothetical protein
MSERKQVRKPFFVASVIITVLLFGAAVTISQQTRTYEQSTYDNDSVMTAEGIFDRVELVDRHYGNWNGQEVEGEVLAVLYENGSIEISTDHYEARAKSSLDVSSYDNGTTYPFFLYVYDGTNHLRERVSVEGGTPEAFIFLNVTITVSLDTIVGTEFIPSLMPFGTAVFLGCVGLMVGFVAATTPRKHWVNV